MPIFPSREWLAEAVRLFNADPETPAAGKGWVGEVGFVVLAEPGRLRSDYGACLWPSPTGGVLRHEYLEDAEELSAFRPAYVLSAPYSVWKSLLKAEMDPVEAVLLKRVEIEGDLRQIMERFRFRGIIERVLSQLETNFSDDPGPGAP